MFDSINCLLTDASNKLRNQKGKNINIDEAIENINEASRLLIELKRKYGGLNNQMNGIGRAVKDSIEEQQRGIVGF